MEECPCIVHAWIMRDVYTPRTHNLQTHIYGPINCWVGWKVYNINVLINYWYKLAHISIASSCNGIPYATYSVWMLFSLYLSLLLCVSLCAFMYACVNAYFHFFSSMLLLFLLFSLTYFDFFVHRSKSILKCMAWTTTVLQSASSLPFHWIFFNFHLTFFFILFMLCFHQRCFTVVYKNEAFFFWLFIFSVVLAEAWIFIRFDFVHCSNGKSSMNGVFYYSNHAENMHRTLWKWQRKNHFKVFFSIQSFSSRVVIILVCRSDHNRALKAYVLTELRVCV